MRIRSRLAPGAALATALVLRAPHADAAFHLMKIVEVFAGTTPAPNAQYVVLQMYAAGQNLVAGHAIDWILRLPMQLPMQPTTDRTRQGSATRRRHQMAARQPRERAAGAISPPVQALRGTFV